GWIAFNLTAFGIAVLAHRTPWLSRVAHRARSTPADAASAPPGMAPAAAMAPAPVTPAEAAAANPTAAFLMPLLAILAAGMISHALSAGFEFLYPLRWIAALAVLWYYRKDYST